MPYVVNSLKLLLTATALYSVMLLVSHLALVGVDKYELNQFAERTLQRTQKVYTDSTQLLFTPNNGVTLCSKSDLQHLRDQLWDRKYLKDVGRVDNQGRIICTVNWGSLNQPIQLPKPSAHWSSGINHWSNVPNILHRNSDVSNLFTYNNMLIMLSPFAYDLGSLNKPKNVTAILATKDLQYIFRIFGNEQSPNTLLPLNNQVNFRSASEKLCLNSMPLCVIGRVNKAGFGGLSDDMKSAFLVMNLFITGVILRLIRKIKAYRCSMLYRLKKAINNNALYVEFQPKFALVSNTVIGFEALVRWQDKQFGKVPPDVFIELAEKNKLMSKLTRLVIFNALKDLSETLKAHPKLSVSINLAMENLSDKSLLPYINQLTDKFGLLHKQLIFEVTERSIIGFENIESSIQRFAESQYQISLDDFGTGYANLSWLGKLNAQEIKVDKIFTQSIGTDSVHSKTLNAIFILLRELDVRVVFEGVETQEQCDFLRSRFQHAIGQGWLFARAMPIKQLEDYLNELKSKRAQANQDPVLAIK